MVLMETMQLLELLLTILATLDSEPNTTYGITTATYDGNTGIVTLTSADAAGKVKVGDLIELRDLNFECNSGSGISTQLFPSGKFGFEFYVNKINDDGTIAANVGVSTIPHTYVSGGVIVDRFVWYHFNDI